VCYISKSLVNSPAKWSSLEPSMIWRGFAIFIKCDPRKDPCNIW
jgi:hypothetical protein